MSLRQWMMATFDGTERQSRMVLAHNCAMLFDKLNEVSTKPPTAAALGDVAFNVSALRQELTAAIERKPNRVLLELIHGLRTTRFELSEVQEQLRRNNDLLERLMRDGTPTARPVVTGTGGAGGTLPALLRRQVG